MSTGEFRCSKGELNTLEEGEEVVLVSEVEQASLFSFTLGWLVLKVQNMTTSSDSGGPMAMSKGRFFLVLEQGKKLNVPKCVLVTSFVIHSFSPTKSACLSLS